MSQTALVSWKCHNVWLLLVILCTYIGHSADDAEQRSRAERWYVANLYSGASREHNAVCTLAGIIGDRQVIVYGVHSGRRANPHGAIVDGVV